MKKDTVVSIDEPETTRDALTEVLREGATKLIAEAVQAEAAAGALMALSMMVLTLGPLYEMWIRGRQVSNEL